MPRQASADGPWRCLWCRKPTPEGQVYCSEECRDETDAARLKDALRVGPRQQKAEPNPCINGTAYMRHDPHHGVAREPLRYRRSVTDLGRVGWLA